MIVTFTKRYCYSQIHSWSGGFGKALTEVGELRAKHPDDNIVVEFNERSSSTMYRVVRYTSVEIEVPDMPTREEFEVPKRPKAKRLAPETYEQSISESKDAWGYKRRTLTLTHIESGESVSRNIWYSPPNKYELSSLRQQLEELVDITFSGRNEIYKSSEARYQSAIKEWQQNTDKLLREAVTTG